MKNKPLIALYIILCTVLHTLSANNTTDSTNKPLFIKVHFLYGSKPTKKFKQEELSWFGGMLGGHVGIEKDSGTTFDFTPAGSFHVFGHKKICNSHFVHHSIQSFYAILGSPADSVKQLRVIIPISAQQRQLLDSLEKRYMAKSPYDYAFFGMRCGAAAYDVLSQIGITKKFGRAKTWRKIFYPKKLRKRLLKMARKNNWRLERQEGTRRRKWEKD